MLNFKDLSNVITKYLDMILPSNLRCVVVLFDTDDNSVCTVSDMSDEDSASLLIEAADVLQHPEKNKSNSFDIPKSSRDASKN